MSSGIKGQSLFDITVGIDPSLGCALSAPDR